MTELNENLNQPKLEDEAQNSINTPQLNTEEATVEPVEVVNPLVETTNASETSEQPVAEHEADQDDADANEMHEHEEMPNFTEMSKESLVEFANQVLQSKTTAEAIAIFREIQPVLDQLEKEETELALEKFIEEGGEKDDFEYKNDGKLEWFYATYKELKNKRNSERKAAEAERINNLKRKEEILEKMKELVENEETAQSLQQLKDLQSEWKLIRNIPKESIERLWETYHVLNERFYDRLSINNELKELDRSKNLDLKINLIAEVSKLAEETSIKKALISVKKLQEEWKHIGPVAREASEDIWQRFKAEVDKIYEQIKAKTAEMDALREQNLALKKQLIAKAKELSTFKSVRIKEWMDKAKEAADLMNEWKKIGYVPLALRDSIWEEFKSLRNEFYNNKNNFFKDLQNERKENLKAKELLCEQAEHIAQNPIDWNKQANELKDLQNKWKNIGQVPEKQNDLIWKRFRAACDNFFEQKTKYFESQKSEQLQNLEAKKQILLQLEELQQNEEVDNVFAQLKEIQQNWNQIGFVPFKEKDALQKRYSELLDTLYGKFKQLSKDMRVEREKQHLELIAQSPNGNQKIKREEKVLAERIRGLQKDIDTWENNLGFFKSGNSVNPMAEQIENKIAIARKHIEQLKEKLKIVKSYQS